MIYIYIYRERERDNTDNLRSAQGARKTRAEPRV